MDIKAKMNGRFRDLQGGLFLEVTKADVGEGWLRIVTACFASDEDAAVRFERIKAALTRLAKEKGIA